MTYQAEHEITLGAYEQELLINGYQDQIKAMIKENDQYGYEHSKVIENNTKIAILKEVIDELKKRFDLAFPPNRLEYDLPMFFPADKHKKKYIIACYWTEGLFIPPSIKRTFVVDDYGDTADINEYTLIFDSKEEAIEIINKLNNGWKDKVDGKHYHLAELQETITIPHIPYLAGFSSDSLYGYVCNYDKNYEE